jgi:ABC-2 type transport system permease protein
MINFKNEFLGTWTLLKKELLRFWRVVFQTVAAPVITAVLYLLIFSHVLANHVKVYDNIEYTAFLIPGLIMMSLLQNSFANSSSSSYSVESHGKYCIYFINTNHLSSNSSWPS